MLTVPPFIPFWWRILKLTIGHKLCVWTVCTCKCGLALFYGSVHLRLLIKKIWFGDFSPHLNQISKAYNIPNFYRGVKLNLMPDKCWNFAEIVKFQDLLQTKDFQCNVSLVLSNMQMYKYTTQVQASGDMDIRESHLQFFLISLLFQAGIYARHTKEQE